MQSVQYASCYNFDIGNTYDEVHLMRCTYVWTDGGSYPQSMFSTVKSNSYVAISAVNSTV